MSSIGTALSCGGLEPADDLGDAHTAFASSASALTLFIVSS
jgi:hypothetical protein